METEIISALDTYIGFRSIAGNTTQKQACLSWIEKEFLPDASCKRTSGSCNECPYLLLEHPQAQWLWFAHCDVVPASETQFSLSRDGDTLRGRGVKDMKGAALPFLLAYRDACRKGKVPEVSILLSTDEEIGGRTIPELITKGLRPEIAFTPDTGSAVGIVVEHKGAVWAELRCEGSSGHGAMPWTARNPLMLLSEALSRIAQQYPPGTENDWRTTISPTILQGGDAQNRIPQSATAILDIRYPPDKFSSVQNVLDTITQCLPQGCVLTIRESATPLRTDRNHPFIRKYEKIVTDVQGAPPTFIREHGATDARHFCAAGVPAFLYGPRGGGLHGSDEWVSLSSLMDHYRIYERLFISLDSRG